MYRISLKNTIPYSYYSDIIDFEKQGVPKKGKLYQAVQPGILRLMYI